MAPRERSHAMALAALALAALSPARPAQACGACLCEPTHSYLYPVLTRNAPTNYRPLLILQPDVNATGVTVRTRSGMEASVEFVALASVGALAALVRRRSTAR